ncbi:hypothetical protein BCU58_025645, partial [Vibrio sp. 10N.286.48.B7]
TGSEKRCSTVFLLTVRRITVIDRGELSALIAPLKLRRHEKKALINEALMPLFTYTLSPE